MDEMTHRVPLSNGKVVLLIERLDSLHIALECPQPEHGVDAYLATIDSAGITVMCNSGDANMVIADGLGRATANEG